MAKTAARRSAKRMGKQGSAKAARKPAVKVMSAAQAIRGLDGEFMKAANARDAGAVVRAFYAPDAVLLPPNHPIVEGRSNIQAFLQGLMDSGLSSIRLETTRIASDGALAYGRGRYTLSLAPAAAAPVEDVGKYVVVYRRQPDGSWRAVADIFNSDRPTA